MSGAVTRMWRPVCSRAFARRAYQVAGPSARRHFAVDTDGTAWAEYPGARSPVATTLAFTSGRPESDEARIPTFRLLDLHGKPLARVGAEAAADAGAAAAVLDDEAGAVAMHRAMLRLAAMDTIFAAAQRQGRLPFYMTSEGEEGATVGSAAGLDARDVVFGQYRETGVLLWRGFTAMQFSHSAAGTERDGHKGRRITMCYGSRELNFVTISPPLATQLPQAVGAAFALKAAGAQSEGKAQCVACYFGEGAAMEGDFHAAFNLASVKDVPLVFLCRNNGYSISTPSEQEYHSDGIAARMRAYGLPVARVDGNDVFAVRAATAAAREMAAKHNQPTGLELMSYRRGNHSSSDDWHRYRPEAEVQHWREHNNPISRSRHYLISRGWWDDTREAAEVAEASAEFAAAMDDAEAALKPPVAGMLSDVYKEMPRSLRRQAEQLQAHLAAHGDAYELQRFRS